VLSGWAGDYYGVPDASTMDAIRLLGRLEGIIIDPVYEGKSMAGLVGLAPQRRDRQGLHRALRPPGRPAGAQRLWLPVLLGPSEGLWVWKGAFPLLTVILVGRTIVSWGDKCIAR
jgi:hypothetical protein